MSGAAILQGQRRSDHPKTSNDKRMIWKFDFDSVGLLLKDTSRDSSPTGKVMRCHVPGKSLATGIFQLQAILELSESGPDVLALVGPSLLHHLCLSLDPQGRAMTSNGMGTYFNFRR